MIHERNIKEEAVHQTKSVSGNRTNPYDTGETAVTLEAVAGNREILRTVDLGSIRIPVNQIAGVAAKGEGSGAAGQLRCYEYLGKFYVCGDKGQIALLKNSGAVQATASVVRLVPAYSEEKEIRNYYEFLTYYPLLEMYQIQFTQPGFFRKFQKAMGHDAGYAWTVMDRNRFLMHWYVIEAAFYAAFDRKLNVTPADALVVLLEDYSFSQIRSMPAWLLTRVFQSVWKKLRALNDRKPVAAELLKPATGKLQTAS